ncbi:similar to Saccharomyces cerevisiae YJL109C UTP10 Nucleolar protein [Maudiozyma saulgeensis]|uniref:U3 small nucleolar RNA-associated protein 10 n=1 Tax=Maudiozyma saulgeensis TaxID=1789683 RepID=A0A1X7QXW1_9SACH|nr:similar to Saccharomyces cerevisiae YJL109C UTP10 Nucleolar protein [Kazachstania saulgeensis]
MSSLSEQLAQVAANNSTVAFDRKRRQKLHSASLIYNPKTAATQDYDFIFDNALTALNELIDIDPRFGIFTKSLFSETSISIDRNVQSKEENKNLDNAINGYLLLASSRWNLTPTLHATEWLVRRFQIHIVNAEMLLLSTLNYYQSPVFQRILNIVKLPPLFNPLSNFVKNDSTPTNLTMVKLFNDNDFLKLYANYLNKCLKQQTTYTNQLLFITCCFINLISFNSVNEEKLNTLVPLLLEISAKLLASASVDCQIAAHTILVVFATALPLKKVIILAATETILANLSDEKAKKSALSTIFKMFQTLKGQGNIDHLPNKLYTLFDSRYNIEYIAKTLSAEDITSCDKFITTYARAITRYDQFKLSNIVAILEKVKLEKYEVRMIIMDLINLSEIIDDKSQLIELFEYFVKNNEKLVISCLKSLNIAPEIFEIRLTTSLFSTQNETADIVTKIEAQKVVGEKSKIPSFKEFLDKNAQHITTGDFSLLAENDEIFSKQLSLFVEAVGKNYQPGLFLSSFFTTLEARITFLARISISPAAPVALRLIALSNISKYLHSIDKESNVFSIVPCLICSLNDSSRNIRITAKKVLTQISKRPSSKHYFMANDIYGKDIKVPMLSPKDSETWLNKFLDEYIVENRDLSNVFIPKKNDKIYLLFWADQALYFPLPQAKIILLDNLKKYSASTTAYSSVFESFLKEYLSNRQSWEIRCKTNKCNFKDFERRIVDLISEKEKNQNMISFIIDALKSEHEQLSELITERLIKIFDTLKTSFQLQILQSIIETTIEPDQSYDTIGTIQALPLNADLINTILSQNKINSDTEVAGFSKRRRRSSSNKSALQKEEISILAENHMKKLTVVLEALDKQNVQGSADLLSTLLSLLSDLETLDQDGHLPVLYAQETIASCILNTIASMKSNGVSGLQNVRADIVVSGIRNTASPQLQNKLLLVISALASLSPETILHSVMPIFTFMGAHSIRQDDGFTTQVVEKTISTVVPALLDNSTENLQDEIEFLLMSFTTALQHVPKHRRIKLYSTLVQTLGASRSLGPFFFLIAQQYSTYLNEFKLGDAKTVVEFAKAFLGKFEVKEQLTGVSSFFNIIETLVSASMNEDKKQELETQTLFSNGILNLPSNELSLFVKNSFDFINKTIQDDNSDYYTANGSFRVRVYSSLIDVTNDAKEIIDIKSEFSNIIRDILLFINDINTFNKNSSTSSDSDSDTKQSNEHYDELKATLFSLLQNMLSVLPIEDFIETIKPLLNSKNNDIRYHITLVIGTKFDLEPIDVAPTAEKVINYLLEQISTGSETTLVSQVMLNTIALLINKFGSNISQPIINKSLDECTKNLSQDKVEIIISSLSVITNSIQVLGIKTIAYYPRIVKPSIELFKKTENNKETFLRSQLQLSIMLLFATMVKSMPSFVLSNLFDVLHIIFFADEIETTVRLSAIDLIISNIDLKEVLKVLYKSWITEVSTLDDSVTISLYMSALEATVEAADKKTATFQSPTFFKLLLSLFEYRSTSAFDNNTISRIEASVYQIANSYVLKMNDKVFRPLFAVVVRWAFDGEGVTNTKMSEVERYIAFFKFFTKLQENLKGIITNYFTYILEPVNNLLLEYISKKMKDISLQRLLFISLTSSFKYDKDEYWKATSRFELISESLINQLGVVDRVLGRHLVKAIGSLAAANNGVDEHNQIMNKLLINHMKATCTSQEKLWAAKSIKLIYSKVGESWLVLLPQLVPTIAELLEDDDEEIEDEVRTGLVKVVENVLGEPFDRYLD